MKLKLIEHPNMTVADDLTIGQYYDCAEQYEGGVFYYVIDDAGDGHVVEKECFETMEEYSGDDLPPVGTVCEFQRSDGSWNGPAKVFAHHETGGAFVEYIDHVAWDHSPVPKKFRPIKSEKDKEIEEFIKDMSAAICVEGVDDTFKSTTRYLYNLGYRKTHQ